MFKPIALIYLESQKRPLFIGYSKNEEKNNYTIHTSLRTIRKNVSSLDDVTDYIEFEFGWHPNFGWLPLWNINSLVI